MECDAVRSRAPRDSRPSPTGTCHPNFSPPTPPTEQSKRGTNRPLEIGEPGIIPTQIGTKVTPQFAGVRLEEDKMVPFGIEGPLPTARFHLDGIVILLLAQIFARVIRADANGGGAAADVVDLEVATGRGTVLLLVETECTGGGEG